MILIIAYSSVHDSESAGDCSLSSVFIKLVSDLEQTFLHNPQNLMNLYSVGSMVTYR